MEGGEHIIKNSQRNITIIIAFLFLLGMTAFIQPAMAVTLLALCTGLEAGDYGRPDPHFLRTPGAPVSVATEVPSTPTATTTAKPAKRAVPVVAEAKRLLK